MKTKTKYTRTQFMEDLMVLQPCGAEVLLADIPGNLFDLAEAVKKAVKAYGLFNARHAARQRERDAIRIATGDHYHPGLKKFPMITMTEEEQVCRRLAISLRWLRQECRECRECGVIINLEGAHDPRVRAARRLQRALKAHQLDIEKTVNQLPTVFDT